MGLSLSFLSPFIEHIKVWCFLVLYNLHVNVGADFIETKGCIRIFNTHQRGRSTGVELRDRNNLKDSFRANETVPAP